jgi:hypothetical protein
MVCSPAQLSANRKNAARSNGPRTELGNSRSRRNAIKHGLTGEGVAVLDEDQGAIQDRFEAFEADLKPKDSVAEYLVRRLAMMSVRMDRSVRHESAEITNAMLGAKDAEARAQEILALVASIGVNPAETVQQLRRTPEGFDWMIREWRALEVDLAAGRWKLDQLERLEPLLGIKLNAYGTNRARALTLANCNDFRRLGPSDWPDLAPDDRRRAALAEMALIITAEIDRLEKQRAGLDHDSIARRAASAPARALFGTSKDAILARKYEAAAEREFYRALKHVEQLNAREAADEPSATVDATDDEETESAESGSFFPSHSIEQGPPSRGGISANLRPILPVDRPRKANEGHRNPSRSAESC